MMRVHNLLSSSRDFLSEVDLSGVLTLIKHVSTVSLAQPSVVCHTMTKQGVSLVRSLGAPFAMPHTNSRVFPLRKSLKGNTPLYQSSISHSFISNTYTPHHASHNLFDLKKQRPIFGHIFSVQERPTA